MMHILQFKPIQWMLTAVVAILFLMVGAGQFVNEPQVRTPCSAPLTFRVGNIDERFSIHREEVIGFIEETSEIWSDAAGTPVVDYDEQGDISVNLVYAEEQQLTDRERQYSDRLKDEEAKITALENEYTRLNQQYEDEVQQYDEDSRDLEQTIDRLNAWVVQKNEQGGFNKQDLKQFERRKAEIDQVKLDLTQQEQALKLKAAELNDKTAFLKQRVEAKNQLVDEYNRQFAGEWKFTQGAYEWTNNSRSINIFQFLDKSDLRFVIAHEMGHALGMTHVSNPKSVMHELVESQNRSAIELTNEDIQALKNVCMDQLN